ncbi:SWF or SNF family helicase [Streptomyces lushanensis]|uniref:SWF or SNF family helicase n=1 Tax=Streptomyces lushanensis TaxID=1434255 RepID=UPI0008325526|nr:SWF or SNF family helicase [Streptomyces lushanensis]
MSGTNGGRGGDSWGDEDGGRGGDGVERTFAAQAPARGRGFAHTWWGRAWLKALEETALDGAPLAKGRRHAREGAVGAVTVRPGRITAVVQDRDGTTYRSDVLLQRLSEEEWDRFLDMAVDRAGHIAALLDREMPPHLVEDAAAAGVELLPGIGDLEPECGCEAWDHCAHSAALCYRMAGLLDQDPFVLLLIRGRSERRLLDELQVRSVARASRAAGTKAEAEAPDTEETTADAMGVSAVTAFAARDILPPLPAPPPIPREPGQPPALDTGTEPSVADPSSGTGASSGVDVDALELLAADAAARALRMLSDALAPDHEQQPLEVELTLHQDSVRLAATTSDTRLLARLAAGTGRQRAELDLAVRAWRFGGAAALAVLEGGGTPEPEALARAQAALDTAWEDGRRPRLRAMGAGRWSVADASAQLRYGDDGRWWPYRKEHGRWAPAGPAGHDPAAALAEVLNEGREED